MGSSFPELGALRLLHDDGTWGQWFPVRSASRAATERAMNKLCADRTIPGFERRDIQQDEFDALKQVSKVVVTLEEGEDVHGQVVS